MSPGLLSRYGLVVLNGTTGRGYYGDSIPTDVVDNLVEYVKSGGALLVTEEGFSGSRGSSFNPLMSKFGLTFKERAGLDNQESTGYLTDHPAVKGLAGFYAERGVGVEFTSGDVLGKCGEQPVIVAAQFGRGKVVAAGVGRAFMGAGLAPQPIPRPGALKPIRRC